MEKYTVVKVINHEVGTFQKVHVKDKKGATKDFYFDTIPELKSGITLKVYKNLKDSISAYSCKVNGKQFVRLPILPCTEKAFSRFYDVFKSADACALDVDICSALKVRGVKPTMNKANNLRLFISEMKKVR